MGHTFAIGDIHGCLTPLLDMIDTLEALHPGGRIVFLGDYVDRGPDSAGVLRRIMAGPQKPDWTWLALKGNHEQLMVEGQTSLKTRNFWLANGGDATQASFGGNIPAEILHWTNHLPKIHIDRNRIFVHAGVDRDLPLDAQTAGTLLWRRPQPEDDHGAFWGRHLCHGHTPGNDNPRTTGSRTNVDSGCVFGKDNVLAAAVFDDDIAGPPLSFIKIANRG